MTHNKKSLWLTLPFILVLSCQKRESHNSDPLPSDTEFTTGWMGTDNPDEIPSNIFLGFGNNNLPSSYLISGKLPPVGDQGRYGTCVTWAVGYNMKTMLNAIDKNWSAPALSNPQNQTSPKDLFLAIPSNLKGTNCNGTNFEPAFTQLVNRGSASLNSAPYESMGNCSQSPDPSNTTEAGKNKLSNFRKITMDVTEIKTYLSQNRPVVFGAKLSDNFMTWRGDQVISSHSSFVNVGQHARHAMLITGYDDNKGPNGAFRVVNSWGAVWGDRGFIWIDYNFMVNPNFGMMAFVATNGVSEDYNPVDPPDNTVVGEYDLVPWNVEDIKHPDGGNKKRRMYYNVYNRGHQTILASQRWNIVYLYYNAFNANDFGILLYDEYTNQYGRLGEAGKLASGGLGEAGNWWNHINLPPGQGVAEVLYDDTRVRWDYTMPNITGFYYLVSLADAFDVINETDEANNYYFITDSKGWPLYINNGVVQNIFNRKQESEGPASGKRIDTPSPKDLSGNKNAYSPSEISNMIKELKANGKLKMAIEQFESDRAAGN